MKRVEDRGGTQTAVKVHSHFIAGVYILPNYYDNPGISRDLGMKIRKKKQGEEIEGKKEKLEEKEKKENKISLKISGRNQNLYINKIYIYPYSYIMCYFSLMLYQTKCLALNFEGFKARILERMSIVN